jgi:hypothetical protein
MFHVALSNSIILANDEINALHSPQLFKPALKTQTATFC